MQIYSSAFKNNEPIPPKYTSDGKSISPPLAWSGLPPDCKSLVLICEDPDAAEKPGRDYPITHWVAYNISPSVTALKEAVEVKKELYVPVRMDQGKNTLGQFGYSGPKPPAGDQPHRYIFTLHALDIARVAAPGVEHRVVREAMQGHLLETARTMGTYMHNQPLIKQQQTWQRGLEF